MARHAHPRRAGIQPRQSPGRVPAGQDPAPGPGQSRARPHQNPAGPGPDARPHHRRHLRHARLPKARRADHPRPAVRRPGRLPARRPRHRLDDRRDLLHPGQPQIHRPSGVRPRPQRQARHHPGQVVLVRSAHPSRDRGPGHLAGGPAGRGGASQLSGRGDLQPGQLADLPVPVPDPVQDLQTPDVRAAQTAPRPQERPRVLLLRMPVQPQDRQPRRRRPRSSPHRPGPGRPAAGRDAARAGRLRPEPPAASSASPSSSPPPPPRRRNSTTGRPPPCTSGSSGSPRRRTT